MKKSPYITEQGFVALRRELDELWRRIRPEVTRALADAAAEGDRSENAEYIYRKKQLREIDRRVRYLSKRMDELKVVRDLPRDRGRVFFGATVVVVDESENSSRYRIVGSDETDAKKGWISVDSPVARALLGKAIGEEVEVVLPEGSRVLEVVSVEYQGSP